MTTRSAPLFTMVLGLAAAAHAETCACHDAWNAYASFAPAEVYNQTTGQELRNYAPDRRVDLGHMKLELTIPDMNTPRLSAVEELTFAPLGQPLSVLTLDAENFTLGEITGTGGTDVESVS